MIPHFPLLLVWFLALALCLSAADPYTPEIQPASNEAEQAQKRIRVPQGMQLSLWAAEPLLANPVIFCIDQKNRIYVAETFRLHAGVTDIRGHQDWLNDDLACRTVEDRLAMMRRRLGKQFASYGIHHERIRLLEDTSGAGKADKSTVFADGFNRPQDGIAAGLLARGQDVYYACIPDLWLLRDSKNLGKADQRKVLHTGYGVRFGFIGHDLHGLTMGPDGKLYFSIGDRGLNVKTKDRHLVYPDTGSVLRCNLDGSDLEVFATGLRNPQELAFDRYGNLFTGDNNSDSGDRARWVYLVEGGDCGWRIGYQFEAVQGSRGPWNAEKLWHPPHPEQPAWIIPPVAHLGDGPSGLVYYPGVGLPPRYDNHFFLADFRGGPGNSGIRSFSVKPKGAGFELVDSHEFVWGVLATDVDFGTDGAMYISDWVNGWGLTGKGRIWKVSDPKYLANPAIARGHKALAEGMTGKPVAELAGWLEHPNQRVRQEAQFALAAQGEAALPALTAVMKSSKNQLARLHAIWGVGQIGRRQSSALAEVPALLTDADPEVRAQAAKVLGEGKYKAAVAPLLRLLGDESLRVQFFAAQALGKLADATAFPALVQLVRQNADRDPYLRHAAVVALAACGNEKLLAEAATDAAPAVRRAVLLAHRRLHSAGVARFLDDVDVSIVTEAARAINDVPIESAFASLAKLIDRQALPEPLGYRVLNANYRLGQLDNARALARAAGRADLSIGLRKEALNLLGKWEKPEGRDRVMGVWRPLSPRPANVAPEALKPALASILTGPDSLRKSAVAVAAQLGIREIGPTLFGLLEDAKRPAEVRVEVLRGLAALEDDRLDRAIELALTDTEPRVRAEGRRLLAIRKPDAAIASLEKALKEGTILEKQQAFEVLGNLKNPAADKVLAGWLDRLLAGEVPAEARLDLIEASEKRPALADKLARYESARPKEEAFGRWRDTLVGGDVENGRRLFLYRSELSCLRCHKVGGEGVGEVGPDLTGIAARQTRPYLLESILYPSKQIAKGYETVDLVLTTGQVRSGIVRAEDDKFIRLLTADGTTLTVAKDKIEERKTGKSAMPEDLSKHLSRKEMRDLIEFLASLKEGGKK
jgi:quinoprotein glucose dehydrogenase